MTSHKAIFNSAELAFIKARAGTITNDELRDVFATRFKRADITPRQIKDCCNTRGWPRGVKKRPRNRTSFIDRGGDLMVAVDTLEGFRRAKHLMWEDIFGPFPKGYMLMPLNGDKLDLDPLNWIMLTNSMMSRLRQSAFFTAPPELRQTIFAAAKLKQAWQDRMAKRFR